jgi:protein-S-isoprenylcysteine O-methyltransferase Ste14
MRENDAKLKANDPLIKEKNEYPIASNFKSTAQTPTSSTPATMSSTSTFRIAKRHSDLRANILALESALISIVYIYAIAKHSPPLPQAYLLGFFGVAYLLRLNAMAIWLLPRELALEEITFVPLVWLTSIMASFVWKSSDETSTFQLLLSTALYVLGSYLNSYSELQRKWWKEDPRNKGRCYMLGLFALSRNINYFGDTVLFSGWAIATGAWWNAWVPIVMGLSFWFHHIPDKEQYLETRYQDEWPTYKNKTPYAFVPLLC